MNSCSNNCKVSYIICIKDSTRNYTIVISCNVTCKQSCVSIPMKINYSKMRIYISEIISRTSFNL